MSVNENIYRKRGEKGLKQKKKYISWKLFEHLNFFLVHIYFSEYILKFTVLCNFIQLSLNLLYSTYSLSFSTPHEGKKGTKFLFLTLFLRSYVTTKFIRIYLRSPIFESYIINVFIYSKCRVFIFEWIMMAYLHNFIVVQLSELIITFIFDFSIAYMYII